MVIALAMASGAPMAAAQTPSASPPTKTQKVAFDIPAGPLADALTRLAVQSDLQVLFAPELVERKTSPGLSGQYTPIEALERLLEGSGLTWERINETTVVLKDALVPVRVPEKKEPPALGPETKGATELGTVVVTATKRAKSERDIAGSVSAVTGEQLEQMHAQGLKDYLKLVPGVTFIDQGADESIPIIRGIATETVFSLAATAPTTGIFMDDMPFTTLYLPLSVPDINPFDLERVEVLKGPQGTLFGGGALAGAVRYITHRPDLAVWDAKFSQTVSDTKEGVGFGQGGFGPVTAGALNVPLGDSLALRAVGIRRRDGGLYDMRAVDNNGNDLRNDPNADSLRQDSGRVLASWNPPIENLKLSAFYFTQKTRRADTSFSDDPKKPRTGDTVGFPFPSPRIHNFGGGNFLATYDLGWGQLLSTTNRTTQRNWIDAHQEFGFSLDHQNQTEFFFLSANKIRGFTQELRLSSPEDGAGPWQWVVGAAYLNQRQDFWQLFHLGPVISPPKRKDQITEQQRDTDFLFDTFDELATERALFGDVTRRLGEHFEVTAGGRWFRNHLGSAAEICGAEVLALFQMPCEPDSETTGAKGFNPKVSLRFLLNRNVQTYALVAKGFQFGGFQINPPTTPGVTDSAQNAGFTFGPYKSSTLWNYETGIRTDWFNRRLRLDLTAFLLRWRDLQLTVQIPFGGSAGRIPRPTIGIPPEIESGNTTSVNFAAIENVGRAHSKGFEAALAVIPFTGAQWISNAAWISAAIDVPFDGDNPAGPVPPGSSLAGTPHFQWSNVISYQHSLPFFNSWAIGPVLTHTHLGSSPDDIRPTGRVGGYDTLDARLDLTMVSSRFQPVLSFGVNNVTDVRGVTAHFAGTRSDDGSRFDLFHFVQPRTVTLNVSMKF